MAGTTNFKSELVGAMGDPIAENPTGAMQEAAFAAEGLAWRYLLLEVPREALADAMRGMRAMGFRGMNFTIPHKVAVLEHLDALAPSAEIIGAVNTVRVDGDRLIGENTDGKGFMTALQDDAGVDPAGARVVLLGAGGAARAIGVELALAGAAQLTVVNRDPARGRELAELLGARTPAEAEYTPWQGRWRVPEGVDILVNATPVGLYPDVDAVPDVELDAVGATTTVCDVIPNPPHTPFLAAAAARGARTVDGLGMLVHQGAIAFELWTGRPAPVAVMDRALREALGV